MKLSDKFEAERTRNEADSSGIQNKVRLYLFIDSDKNSVSYEKIRFLQWN